MKRFLARAGLVLGAFAALAPVGAAAQTPDDWKVHAIIYGWFPAVGGRTSVPAAGGGSSIEVDASTIIENLKFVFMGTLEARKGRWGEVLAAWRYLDYKFKSDTKIEDLNFSGPMIGVGFRW